MKLDDTNRPGRIPPMMGANVSIALAVPSTMQPITGEYSLATSSGARSRWIAAM